MILLTSWFDNGSQMQYLAEAIRKYTDHDAVHLNCQRTYLDYDTDLYYPDFSDTMKKLELKERIKDCNFFIFSEFLPDDPPLRPILEDFGIYRKLTKNNIIISTGGSQVRSNPERYLFAQLRKGYMYAAGYSDYTITSKIGLVAFTKNICPIDKIPKARPPEDKIRIAFAPTKKEKGVDEYSRVMDSLLKEYPNTIEAVPIIGKSWKEAIKTKSECNITFDQFMLGTYANSAIESLYLEHAVFSWIDAWSDMLFPDLPIINVHNERDLYESLKDLINQPEEIIKIGKEGRAFVETHHHPKVVAREWGRLIDFVHNEM